MCWKIRRVAFQRCMQKLGQGPTTLLHKSHRQFAGGVQGV